MLLGVRVKIERVDSPVWRDLPSYGRKLLIGTGALSLLVHLLSFLSAQRLSSWDSLQGPVDRQTKVKIRLNEHQKSAKDDLTGKTIIETPQTETLPPPLAQHAGPQDHATQKETKLAKRLLNDDRSLDPGVKGKQTSRDKAKTPQISVAKTLPTPRQIISGPGTLAIPGSMSEPRNSYERLLPSKENDVFGTPTAGHTEYIDARIPDGDRIDMNTTAFRYISYFTGMRKAIEMVWIYPREAVERGLQGEVQLEVVIEKDGKVSKVRLVNSSGYAVLDANMLQTIRLASPFAPLPKSWNKERILVTGAFHYILSYGAH